MGSDLSEVLGPLYLGVDLVYYHTQLSTNGVDRGCIKVTSVTEGAVEDVGECGFGHGIVY